MTKQLIIEDEILIEATPSKVWEILTLPKIGDFSLLSNGQMYYDASVEFAENSKQVIKQLAEN